MAPRTEEEKLTQAPIKVRFGDQEYSIKPLPVMQQREWRKKTSELLGPVLNQLQVTRVANNTLVTGLPQTIAPFVDQVCELLFLYAKDLDKEKILGVATEEQIAVAFSRIWDLVYQDFLSLLARATEMLKPTLTPASASN